MYYSILGNKSFSLMSLLQQVHHMWFVLTSMSVCVLVCSWLPDVSCTVYVTGLMAVVAVANNKEMNYYHHHHHLSSTSFLEGNPDGRLPSSVEIRVIEGRGNPPHFTNTCPCPEPHVPVPAHPS